jgi:hypothetical protein
MEEENLLAYRVHINLYEISDSHSGEHEDDRCLGCITLLMEAVRTSETSVYFHETTRHYIPESCHPQEPAI